MYLAVSSDIVNGKLSGASVVGAKIYLTDTKTWKIINLDLTVSDYTLSVPASTGGDASAANQTTVQANAGSDASKATAVQGITGGKAVAVSQGSATPPAATVMQNAVSQTATGTDLVTTGYATAIIQVVSSTPMSGGTNVQFWATPDGSTYYPILAHQIGVSANLVTSTTSDGEYRISCSGFQSIEARIAGYSAGTVTIKGYVSPIAAFPTTITGLVGGFSAAPPVNPVLSVAASYVTGDYVGTSSAPMEFTNIARTTGGTFYIPGATLIDIAKQSISGELWLFNSTVAPPLDSAAWTISSADMVKLLCVIPFSTYYATASYSVSQGHPDYVGPYKVVGTSVFGCFVTRGSPSYASLNLTFILGSAQD
jgi:hypothetical protein